MGKLLSGLGTALVVLSVAGFLFLFFGPSPEDLIQGPARPVVVPGVQTAPQSAPPAAAPPARVGQASQASQASQPSQPAPAGATATPTLVPLEPTPQVATPIDRVQIPSIGLDSEVVEAPLVQRGDAITWDIPAFKAGHAQGTAGAGDYGNAVLMGHVASLHSGDVFKDLDRVKVGDEVTLASRGQRFVYEVTEVKTVARTDISTLESTDTPTVSLFTCTGTWLPTVWDYSDRLVVRGELRRIL